MLSTRPKPHGPVVQSMGFTPTSVQFWAAANNPLLIQFRHVLERDREKGHGIVDVPVPGGQVPSCV